MIRKAICLVRMNRPVRKKELTFSPGGFYIKDKSREEHGFDFLDSSGSVQEDDPYVVIWEMEHPFLECFPGMGNIRTGEIAALIECYLETGRDDLFPVEMVSLCVTDTESGDFLFPRELLDATVFLE